MPRKGKPSRKGEATAGEASASESKAKYPAKPLLAERQSALYTLMQTIKEYTPEAAPEGLEQLLKIAEQLEKEMYTSAVNMNDYLNKLTLKVHFIKASVNPPASATPNSAESAQQSVNLAQPFLSTLMFSEPPERKQVRQQQKSKHSLRQHQQSQNLLLNQNQIKPQSSAQLSQSATTWPTNSKHKQYELSLNNQSVLSSTSQHVESINIESQQTEILIHLKTSSQQQQTAVTHQQPNLQPVQQQSNILREQKPKLLDQRTKSSHHKQQLVPKTQQQQQLGSKKQQQQQLGMKKQQQQQQLLGSPPNVLNMRPQQPMTLFQSLKTRPELGRGLQNFWREGELLLQQQRQQPAKQFQQKQQQAQEPVPSHQMEHVTSYPFIPEKLPSTLLQISHNSNEKAITPTQSTGSSGFVPSPSNHIETSSLSQIAHQKTIISLPEAQPLAIVTTAKSVSPFLKESISMDSNQTVATANSGGVSSQPIERLIEAIQKSSPEALSSAVTDIRSVIALTDIAGPDLQKDLAADRISSIIAEELAADYMCKISSPVNKMRRNIDIDSPAGSKCDYFMQIKELESFVNKSTESSRVKRKKYEVNHALTEEIREINQKLIDSVVSISNKDTDFFRASGGGEGTVVNFTFCFVSLSPDLKAHLASKHMSPISPLRLLVPAKYPESSPVILNKFLAKSTSDEFEALSLKVKSQFVETISQLSEPISLGQMARTWDACARKVIIEHAQQRGGGTFSSAYAWENCKNS